MIVIKNAGTKGLGLFATQTIAIGTRILTEKPLFIVSNTRDVYSTVRKLSQADRAAFWGLANGHGNNHTWLTRVEAICMTIRETCRYFLGSRGHATTDGPTTRPTIAKHLLARSIFLSNNFALSATPVVRALFAQISRLNHNCVPNAQGNWNAKLDPASFTIHALREVTKDEELTLSYLTDPGALQTERQDSLRGFGFTCLCAICAQGSSFATASEERRMLVRTSVEDFAQSVSYASDGEGEVQIHKRAELRTMLPMLAAYEEEGIRGREVATMYLAAARLAKEEDKLSEAKELAARGLELDEISVGRDSPLFEESLKSVEDLNVFNLTASSEKPVSKGW